MVPKEKQTSQTYQKLSSKAVLCPFVFCFLTGDLGQQAPQNLSLGVHGMICDKETASVTSERRGDRWASEKCPCFVLACRCVLELRNCVFCRHGSSDSSSWQVLWSNVKYHCGYILPRSLALVSFSLILAYVAACHSFSRCGLDSVFLALFLSLILCSRRSWSPYAPHRKLLWVGVCMWQNCWQLSSQFDDIHNIEELEFKAWLKCSQTRDALSRHFQEIFCSSVTRVITNIFLYLLLMFFFY